MRDLAIAALVPSANDAATALALYVGHGSIPRFVALMNAKARALGLDARRTSRTRTGSTARATSRARAT